MKLCEMLDRSNITELFDRKIDYTVVTTTANKFITSATISNRVIQFAAVECDEPGTWDIEFSEHTINNRRTYSLTGSGNELSVFRMVKDSIMEFISIYHPSAIVFTASDDVGSDSRSNTYERLIRRFQIPGYKYARTDYKNEGYSNFSIVKESNMLSLNELFPNNDITYVDILLKFQL